MLCACYKLPPSLPHLPVILEGTEVGEPSLTDIDRPIVSVGMCGGIVWVKGVRRGNGSANGSIKESNFPHTAAIHHFTICYPGN